MTKSIHQWLLLRCAYIIPIKLSLMKLRSILVRLQLFSIQYNFRLVSFEISVAYHCHRRPSSLLQFAFRLQMDTHSLDIVTEWKRPHQDAQHITSRNESVNYVFYLISHKNFGFYIRYKKWVNADFHDLAFESGPKMKGQSFITKLWIFNMAEDAWFCLFGTMMWTWFKIFNL